MQFYARQPAKKTGKQRKEPLLSFRISQLYFVSGIVLVANNGVKTNNTLDVHLGDRKYQEIWNRIALRGTAPQSPRDADQINADGYAEDAVAAVPLVRALLGL